MNNYDGSIIIGTNIDTKGIDQGINDIEKKVTSKGFGNKFSSMFSSIFSKISSGANKAINTITKGLGSILSSVGGIASAIAKISLIGIIGMILLASNYSETSKTQLQEIANIVLNLADVLARLILPIAEAIVNVIYQAVVWFADILNSFFGIDLFAKRTEKSMKSTTKSAKALRKQLLGFDEMNILNKDGSVGGLGGSGGTGNGGTGGNNYQPLIDKTKVKQTMYKIGEKATGILKKIGLYSLGPLGLIGYALFGKDSKANNKMLNKVTDEIKAKFLDATVTFKDGFVEIKTKTGETFKATYSEYEATLRNMGLTTDRTTGKIVEAVVKGSLDMQSAMNTTKDVINKDFWLMENKGKETSENTKSAFEKAGDLIKKIFGVDIPNSAEEGSKEATDDIIGGIKGGINEYNKNPSKAKVEVKEDSKNNTKTITNNLKAETKNPWKVTVQTVLNTTDMMKKLKDFSQAYPAMFGPIYNALVKKGYHAAKGAIIGLPKLASGGIINRPGKGVPLGVGGAIGGERGREAVIPLTDSQQMALLGREIAKNVIITLNNVTEIDGRQLARTTAQVMNDMQFASNGGVI